MAKSKSNTSQVSFSISPVLYKGFASFAAARQVSIDTLFRHVLKEFAEVSFPDPIADAQFDVLLAKIEAQQSVTDLPSLSAGDKQLLN